MVLGKLFQAEQVLGTNSVKMHWYEQRVDSKAAWMLISML